MAAPVEQGAGEGEGEGRKVREITYEELKSALETTLNSLEGGSRALDDPQLQDAAVGGQQLPEVGICGADAA